MSITISGDGDINATGNDIELNSTGTTDVTLALGGGKVGVGVASPTATLDVNGTIKLDGNYPVGTENVALGDAALDDASLTGAFNTAIGTSALTSNAGGNFNSALGRDSLKANTSGSSNVGAGVSSLLVNTTGSNNIAVGVNALVSNTTASNSVAVGHQAGYNLSTNSGNVFVGYLSGQATTSPQNTFIGSGSGYLVSSGQKNTIIGTYSGNQNGLDIRTSSNNIVLSDGDGNPRAFCNSSGYFYFNSPNGSSVPYSGSGGQIVINNTFGVGVYNVSSIVHSTGGQGHIVFINNNGNVGSINTSGSSTSYNTSSDYRLKENVVELTGATDRLKQLNPSRFNFIADPDTTVDGFLAHEVQAIVPEAVTGEKDAVDADGNIKPQGIYQSKLVPLLTQALKEAITKIEALETANADMLARIEALEAV